MAKVIVVLGPTCSGKTDFAINLALQSNAEIINADSRQIYKELNIGVAKPEINQLNKVKHHLINHVSIHQNYSVGMYETDALNIALQLIKNEKNVILCGGTGLYIKAFCQGLDDLPSNAELRDKWDQILINNGITFLQSHLKQIDPIAFENIDINNPNRLIRAIEIITLMGKPLHIIRTQTQKIRPFEIEKIGLSWDRDILYKRINTRVDQMIQSGLENEVFLLKEFQNLNALKTVGYNEFFNYFKGEYTYETTIDKIKQHTRNYAKRQLTWFNTDHDINWVKMG